LPKVNHIKDVLSALGGQQRIEAALQSNLRWIAKSFEVNGLKGSSGKRTVYGRWGAPYPETTGYLIPTLLECSSYNEGLRDIALAQLSFIKSIQNEDGSFYQAVDNKAPIIFDTSQIVIGLIALCPEVLKFEDISDVTKQAVVWMQEQLTAEGLFLEYNYVDNYNPAYYARIAWAMSQGEAIFYSKITKKTRTLILRIADLQNEDLMFDYAGFFPEEMPFTHTIAYTLRGLWECALYINDKKLMHKVTDSLDHLSKTLLSKGKAAGRYDTHWQGDYSFICSAGNAQLALLYLRVYERLQNKKFLQVVPLLLKPLLAGQRRLSLNKGAVPSSLPIWGPYQKWSFTNWTQKFYADALVSILKMSDRPYL